MDLAKLNAEFATMSALDRLQWSAKTYGNRAVVLGSMQKTSSILIDMLSKLGLENEVLFVDTGFHFHETLRLRDDLTRKYRLNTITLYPEETPEQQETRFGRKLHLFVDGQPECCRLRKEEPFLKYVRDNGKRLVLNGLRKSEGGQRKKVDFLVSDPRFGGHVLHPLLDWRDAEVSQYMEQHRPPIHPLHAKGYPSIGCACCTTPVMPGEEERAGRWRHLRQDDGAGPQYCGINFADGSGI